MNRKNVLMVLVIIVTAFALLSVVSAKEETINGVKFNIPDGYTEDTSNSHSLQDNHTATVKSSSATVGTQEKKSFVKGDDDITISVKSFSKGSELEVSKNPGDVEKTIHGKSGYYDSAAKNFVYFDKENSCFVIIHADEKDLDKIIS